jgi:hypothetical protein
MSAYHVRRVGPEGIATGGNGANARTLCELIVGWDIQEVQLSDLKKERRLCSICERIATAPHLAPLRQ